jgi:hypothetical protein
MNATLRFEELLTHCRQMLRRGESFDLAGLCRDRPDWLPELRRRLAEPETPTPDGDSGGAEPLTVERPEEAALAFLAPAQTAGELGRLGGYRVLGVLGRRTGATWPEPSRSSAKP